ncbi:MAG TPA: FliM/FliN family flagellar motor C-terminal domain-containing protein [Terracidiphilus sp.]|jgi:flagellar motor switch/type III secretory pathway protein FliN|nr:FliM/FliN family flagellar motor C-terminal domain-containing protein [Terracidiphilus sp.]
MASAARSPISPPAPGAPPENQPAAGEIALVASASKPAAEEGISANSVAARLPVELEVGVPVREFRVRNLLTLEPGAIVESQWKHGEDLPLAAGNVQLAWAEFEVVDTQLTARLTRLS